ncbi:hypothetical protein [Ramlibacter sp. AN1133]|uniref:hypothetical protein n=1 Tax=Ramlibacter sp. AN1133 TaxID=3133429 RepID=UPI0030C5DCAD
MDRPLWDAMCADLQASIHPSDEAVSGGAAWSDHLAVHAFLQGWCGTLRLFLPAPLVQGSGWHFQEAGKSAGSAANWYHQRFSAACGFDSIAQIREAIARGAVIDFEPARPGFGGMFARNAKVAGYCTAVRAYTFNAGDEPADGGTMDTWRKVAAADRTHVDLGALQQAWLQQHAPAAPGAAAPRQMTRAERFRWRSP